MENLDGRGLEVVVLMFQVRKKPIFQRDVLGTAVLHVRSGRAISRTTLAKELGISPSTSGQYVDRLIAERLLDESGTNQGPMGRPRRLLKTRSEAGWFAGVEFSAQRMQAVGVDFSGRVVSTVAQPLPVDVKAEMVIQAILESVLKLAESMRGPLLSVGLGVPGLVDPQAGVGIHFTFISDWRQIPVVERVRQKLGVPVILQGSLRVIALAERWFGLGHDLNHYVILGPRSGFGIAMVQEGRVVEGARHAAGEVGLWPWPLGGAKGSTQELHHVLSASATWRRLAGATSETPLPEDLRLALAELGSMHGPVWEAVCEDFARVVGCVQLLTDTELLILHGPLTELGVRFCESIVEAVCGLFPSLQATPPKLVPSELGGDAGALGAASLAMESWAPA
jgi:predicted NBD/HSP70 family sugar kinase